MTIAQLMATLNPDAHPVRYLAHQARTYNPDTEALFVLIFGPDLVESAVVLASGEEEPESD